jgi:hypothetical protein
MRRQNWFGMVCAVAVLALSTGPTAQAQDAAKNASAATDQAAAAVKASPDLVTALSKELGSTPEQAAGAAGSLFGLLSDHGSSGASPKFSTVLSVTSKRDSRVL